MQEFLYKLQSRQSAKKTALCVGLDPDPDRIPRHLFDTLSLPEAIIAFNHAIIEATLPYACAFKLNFAFYEALGSDTHTVLSRTLHYIPSSVITIADAKRGDIGNTARFYARAIFRDLGFDACTVAPYMGRDAVAPFLEYPDKAAFILAHTSNPSSIDFQQCVYNDEPLYERVARYVHTWNHQYPGTAGLVVGATHEQALHTLRALCPCLPFLIPGVGAQGGAPSAISAASTTDGPIIVNSSRSILYASSGSDFARQAALKAIETCALLSDHIHL